MIIAFLLQQIYEVLKKRSYKNRAFGYPLAFLLT